MQRLSEVSQPTFLGCLVRVDPVAICSDYWKARPLLVVNEELSTGALMLSALTAEDERQDAEDPERWALFFTDEVFLEEAAGE